MNFKVYKGDFLAGHGFPIIIVTAPILSGNIKISECHSFYSGKKDSYNLSTVAYNSEGSSSIEDSVLIDSAKSQGENFIYDYMEKNNETQFKAMLAGYIGKIEPAEANEIMQLHLRNFLCPDIENTIVNSTCCDELKEYVRSIAQLNKITTERKI